MDLQGWVGKQQVADDALDVFPARALAAALDHVDLPQAGEVLPPAWHWLYFLDAPTASGTGIDGHPKKGGFLPPVALPRRMWAAGHLEVERPLTLAQPATKRSTIQTIDVKEGKSGTLVFVTLEHELHQGGHRCIVERQTLVYRDMPKAAAPLPPGERASTEADWEQVVTPDPVLLFRYSALTYNGHRIHYDRDYATRQEFYPALVVHGPLLATLLLDLVRNQVRAKRIATFDFRAVRPTFDDAPFTLRGKREGDRVHLWTADAQGFVGMRAEAELV